MEKGQKSQGNARRRRVQRLKKMIMLLVLVWMIFPVGLCVVLFVKMNALGRQLAQTQDDQRQLLEQVEAVTDRQEQVEAVTARQEQEALQRQETALGQQSSPLERQEIMVSAPVAGADGQNGDMAVVEPDVAHKVYLTFDDGPSKYTEEILDILDTYDVKATFFVLGKESEYSIEMLREIARRGHTIGMHSYSHKYAEVYRSVEDFSADFYQIYSYILENTGIQSACYRFPGGSSNAISDIDMHVFADFLAEQEIEYYDWNVSSGDGGSTLLDVDTLVRNVTSSIPDNETSIVLMHDAASRSTTVEALPRIIESILAMEDTAVLPITEHTAPVHHIK